MTECCDFVNFGGESSSHATKLKAALAAWYPQLCPLEPTNLLKSGPPSRSQVVFCGVLFQAALAGDGSVQPRGLCYVLQTLRLVRHSGASRELLWRIRPKIEWKSRSSLLQGCKKSFNKVGSGHVPAENVYAEAFQNLFAPVSIKGGTNMSLEPRRQ